MSWSTHISFRHWFCKIADDNNGDDGKPEENQGKVHVVNLGYDGWTSILFATTGRLISKIQDHAYSTNNEAKDHTPECTL